MPYFEHEGIKEYVEPERWQWVAFYEDGSYLLQFEGEQFHQFREIQQDKLNVFRMTNGDRFIDLKWKSGYKLIHFYRNAHLNVGGPDEQFIRLYCFGYQHESEKVILAIMPDDNIAMVDDIDKLTL